MGSALTMTRSAPASTASAHIEAAGSTCNEVPIARKMSLVWAVSAALVMVR
ncbi:Uncharacterised protein [Mycobacteroides abscessus subsp. abscessus]|nr:Uncharacterised protein [Mycobacteroides abscessus subsp. abscessus]